MDFNRREVGGGSNSFLYVNGGPAGYPMNTNSTSHWTTAVPFGLTGDATLTQKFTTTPGPGEISGDNAAFDGTKIQFNTVDGTAAHQVQVDMKYSDYRGTADGTAKGARR